MPRFLYMYTKKRDIKMQLKYVVLQYLVLGPGLGLEPQVLVNITDFDGLACRPTNKCMLGRWVSETRNVQGTTRWQRWIGLSYSGSCTKLAYRKKTFLLTFGSRPMQVITYYAYTAQVNEK